ncbi:flagella locus protein FlaG [Shewanella sp. NFH-SH190041]|uniref:flagellar protein FlaG n=1 Tax=Shewanella sp. NFH-SH190041 TaxID=2950245 RepID=UPI0021C2AD5F|nr:flagellar protein FlaG [Shewanella sp. NFH-SH190041]BDM63792.1 flagella locus protein FlaG [Shewanella sp. NFH-SH190041]
MDMNVTASSAVVKLDLNNASHKSGAERNSELAKNQLINAPEEAKEAPETERQPTPEKMQELASKMSDMMSMMRKGLAFRVDDTSGKSVVSVMDVESGELIRQIPSEEALELATKLTEVTGLLMKTEA